MTAQFFPTPPGPPLPRYPPVPRYTMRILLPFHHAGNSKFVRSAGLQNLSRHLILSKHSVESFSHKSVSPGTVLSVFCLLLYSAGFIKIEVKFNDHEQRLVAVEKVISYIRQGMAGPSLKVEQFIPTVEFRK